MERDIDRFASSIHLLLPQLIVHPTIHKRFTSQVVLKEFYYIPAIYHYLPQVCFKSQLNGQKQGKD